MNIILLEPDEAANCPVRLLGRRAKHIAKILRAGPGDRVKIGIINGKVGIGTIKSIQKRPPYSVELDLRLTEDPPGKSSIDIILALPRPIMFQRILAHCASLGVENLSVIQANRVEKSFWQASLLADGGWRDHLKYGLEQSVDTQLPQVTYYRGFKPFIEKELPAHRDRYSHLLVAHPTQRIEPQATFGPGKVLLAIGPEGGWVPYELHKFLEAGFSSISLGPRILKVEAAVIALHSMIETLKRHQLQDK